MQYPLVKRNTATNKGFTLIEILVSVAIFTVVMTIALSALVSLNSVLQKAKLLRASIENVNIALESMSKRIRTGSNYRCLTSSEARNQATFDAGQARNCDPSSSTDGFGIAFYSNELGKYIAYRWGNNQKTDQIEFATSDTASINWTNSTAGGHVQTIDAITSGEVSIQRLRFYVSGVGDSDGIQPKVTILIAGNAKLPGKTFLNTQFTLQTTVSQRLFEIAP